MDAVTFKKECMLCIDGCAVSQTRQGGLGFHERKESDQKPGDKSVEAEQRRASLRVITS